MSANNPPNNNSNKGNNIANNNSNKGNNRFNQTNSEDILPDTKKKKLFDDILNYDSIVSFRKFLSQPCFVMPSTVRNKYHYNNNKFMDGVIKFSRLEWYDKPQGVTQKEKSAVKSVFGEIISFFTFNPFFYWYNSKTDKWGSPLGNKEIIYHNFITKFFYCMFKIFGSPLILLGVMVVLFLYFLKSLDLLRLGGAILHTIAYIGTFILMVCSGGTASGPWNTVSKMERDYYVKKGLNSFNPTPIKIQRRPFLDPIIFFFGAVLPFHIVSPYFGKNVGYGGISLLIIIFMILSYILIFLGGINVLFIGGVFIFYLFKLIQGLKNSTTSK